MCPNGAVIAAALEPRRITRTLVASYQDVGR